MKHTGKSNTYIRTMGICHALLFGQDNGWWLNWILKKILFSNDSEQKFNTIIFT